MVDVESIDLDEIADALGDQTPFDYQWLFDRSTGRVLLWTEGGGIDGETPVDVQDLDLISIEPLPSYEWYQDMADFVDGISDGKAARRLARAIQGKGAFRRFRCELHEEYPELLQTWSAFRETRARCRAVEWLEAEGLIEAESAARYLVEHPDPPLP